MQITGVKIAVIYGSAVVRGVIKAENGTLPPETRFQVQVNNNAGELPMMFRPIVVDTRGRFLIESLPVGTHELVVVPIVPGATAPPRRVQQQITVTEGENDVTIVIDLESPENPTRP